MMTLRKISACLFIIFLFSCSDNETAEKGNPYLEVSEKQLVFDRVGDSKNITINTNAKNITTKISPEGWCTATVSEKRITVTTSLNALAEKRTATVSIQADGLKAAISIVQDGRNSSITEIKDDIKLQVVSGTASSFHDGEGIQKSFDGDLSTLYHSSWENSEKNYFPVSLTYNFKDVTSMDYLVYFPRTEGKNGFFKEFDLYVATEENPTLEKYGTYNFNGSSVSSRINFSPALIKPVQIQFVVKSGSGDGQGFVSCAEMEFYKKNPDSFDYSTLFTDPTCSELKSGISETAINAVENQFFRELAMEIFKGEYDSEFRVQNYKSWQHPDIMAKENKTNTYGLRDNPTGIYINSGEELIILVGNTHGQNISLFIQDTNNGISGASVPLSTGLNKIKATVSGLLYIMYYTPAGTEKSIKINIASGSVNGYFDNQKHKKEDWKRILDKATHRHFDVLGKYAALTFETEAFRQYTPDGLVLINKYDELVRLEQDFMGLPDYGRNYKNRAYFLGVYESYMYATGYYTAYNVSTQSDILDIQKFTANACWGPAHELGHIHQTRPGLKWQGMTEVTNNIHSLYVQTSWGNTSRLLTDNCYERAFNDLLKKGIPHNAGDDPWVKLVPFWQLKLYITDILGKQDFYKNIYEAVRNQQDIDTSVITEGYYQLNFIKLACQSACLDLTEFFEAWGFLTPINITIDDYGIRKFSITQEQIDQVKAGIAGKNYPKPKHNNIYYIKDNNLDSFR
ncbi:MAG: M60 family metallopeptidase [Prevotella sp.]|nr:M60 family metallopeptidase [Prevotella sp.]